MTLLPRSIRTKIKKLRNEGMTYRDIASTLDISFYSSYIHGARNGQGYPNESGKQNKKKGLERDLGLQMQIRRDNIEYKIHSQLLLNRFYKYGLPRAWFAKKLGVTTAAFSRLLNGSNMPRKGIQSRLYELLNIPYKSTDEFFDYWIKSAKRKITKQTTLKLYADKLKRTYLYS